MLSHDTEAQDPLETLAPTGAELLPSRCTSSQTMFSLNASPRSYWASNVS